MADNLKEAVVACSMSSESSGGARPTSALTGRDTLQADDSKMTYLQDISKAIDETNLAERSWQQQDSSLTLATVVLLVPDHVTLLAFAVSLVVQRGPDCARVAFPSAVIRELLPSRSPVLARF